MYPSNTKLILCLVILAGTSCKVPYTNFQERNIDESLLQSVPGLMNEQVKIKSIRIYKANLAEYQVARNGVEELQLLNTGVPNPELDEPSAGISHNLYFLYFVTEPQKNIGMFLATTYNINGINTRLGPGYLGYARGKQFNAAYPLKIKETCNTFQLKGGKWLKEDNKIFFYTDEDLRDKMLQEFNITKIVNQRPNKVGADKSLLYDIPAIFGNKNILLFKYDKTITISL